MDKKFSLNVLNIGNSFTDSLKHYFPAVVASVPGCSLRLEAASHGGCELHRHWDYISNEERDGVYSMYNGRKMREILASCDWDIVSIQQASHYSWKYETFQPYASNIVDYVKRHAPKAEVVIQQTWAYRSDDPRLQVNGHWGISQQEMYDRLTFSYTSLAKELGLRIVPTGLAVQLGRAQQEKPFVNYPASLLQTLQWPDLPPQGGSLVGKCFWRKDPDTGELYIGRDTIHLNARGDYLQACVWFAALYERQTSEITFVPEELGAADASFLRKVAQEAVDRGVY